MNPQTNEDVMPDFLDRSKNGVTPKKTGGTSMAHEIATEVKAKGETKATAGVKANIPETDPKPKKVVEKKASAKDEAHTKHALTAPKAAKPAIVKKGKVVKADHKPSTVTATEDNPQKSIVPVRFKERYAAHGDTCGDRIALALKSATTTKNEDGRDAVDPKALAKIAADNGIDFTAYKSLNPGQQRMNVGNRLRGMLRNEKPVVIGKQRFADWEKAKYVAPPKVTEAHAAA